MCLALAQQKTASESGYNMNFDPLDQNLNYDVLDGLLMDRRLHTLGNPGSQMTPSFSRSQHMSSPGQQMTPHRNVFTPVSLPVHSSSPLPHKQQPMAYRQIMPPGSSDASSWYDAM